MGNKLREILLCAQTVRDGEKSMGNKSRESVRCAQTVRGGGKSEGNKLRESLRCAQTVRDGEKSMGNKLRERGSLRCAPIVSRTSLGKITRKKAYAQLICTL